jgi:protein-tyrosine-phosphatase
MDIEQVDVERRAAIHAALGDPARLRIVDALALGDASPGDLAELTGLSTNLLAHHLHVLDTQGLIARAASEGDRRRSYVHLISDPLAAVGGLQIAPPPRVLFVCTANSARSHLAAALWRKASGVPAESAGTHPAARIHPRATATAARHRVPLRRVRPRQVTGVRRLDDLVVTVCDQAHEELSRSIGARGSALHWSVRDPVPIDSDEAFESAFNEIRTRVERLANALSPIPPTVRED